MLLSDFHWEDFNKGLIAVAHFQKWVRLVKNGVANNKSSSVK